jgi:hypothetical protein
MRKDLLLLSKIFALSVIVYQSDLGKPKANPGASHAETHAPDQHAVADMIPNEFQEESLSF